LAVDAVDNMRCWRRTAEGMTMKIETEFIKLDSFLKAENLASSGGEAKILISEGMVLVNGECETRRGRKLYPGDKVELEGHVLIVE